MRLSNCFIVIAVLNTRSYLARTLIKIHQQDSFVNLVNATVKILTSCDGNPEYAVGLAGNVPELLLRELWTQKSLPVILIDHNFITNDPVPSKFRRRLESFVLIASTPSDLKKIFTKIKASVWWNHLASFVILDWKFSFIRGGCSNASQLLWTAWKADVLNAKVVCLHPSQGLSIYTFNPYTNQAPAFWQIQETYVGKNNVPWTLFRRKYGNGKKVCLGLDFDKARDLGGHVIRTSLIKAPQSESEKHCFIAFQSVIIELLFPALNATYKPLMGKTLKATKINDENRFFSEVMADIANGISDISLCSRYPMAMDNLTTLYPHGESGLHAITHYNGYLSQMDKYGSIIDRYTRIGIHAVIVSIIIFFKYFHHHDLMSAIVNVIRGLKNEAYLKLPKDLPSRVYIGSVLLFWVIVSGLYQAKLATVFTEQMDRLNVDTMHDLTNSEHTIYGHFEIKRFFTDPAFDRRFFGSMELVCTHHVLEEKMAACINEKFLLINEAVTYSLHLSREPILRLYQVFHIRDNWPIEHRVNIVMQRLIEADLVRLLHNRRIQKILRLLEVNENKKKIETFQQLSLADFYFLLRVVTISQMCATAFFVVEVGIERFFLRKPNVLKLIRN